MTPWLVLLIAGLAVLCGLAFLIAAGLNRAKRELSEPDRFDGLDALGGMR